jgi:dihydrofolate reductase
MARFLYSAAMSLDGFISGPDGDMSWLADYLGPNPMVDELIPQVGALLVGGRTYGGDDPHRGREGEGKAFGGGWEGPQVVLTRRPRADPEPGVSFVDNLNDAVDAAARAAGDKYVNILGANVAEQCQALGVLDEVLVSIVPLLVGDGTRLFERPGGPAVRLEQISRSHSAVLTSLWFRVIRP